MNSIIKLRYAFSLFPYLVELNHVWVTDFLENFDLSGDSFDIFLVVDLFLLQYFDGNLLKR